jgi:hypothetical protein
MRQALLHSSWPTSIVMTWLGPRDLRRANALNASPIYDFRKQACLPAPEALNTPLRPADVSPSSRGPGRRPLTA